MFSILVLAFFFFQVDRGTAALAFILRFNTGGQV